MTFDYNEVQSINCGEAVTIIPTQESELPLVFGFPHSGNLYPEDFDPNPEVALETIMSGNDSYVDLLYAGYEKLGIIGVKANFPRVYLDVNRNLNDLDVSMLDDSCPTPTQVISKLGNSLIWRTCQKPHAMYSRKLTYREVRGRVANCWIPYQQALSFEIERLRRKWGGVYLIDCHSMRQYDVDDQGNQTFERPEVDIGTVSGITCEPGFREIVADTFSSLGYKVQFGGKYGGGAIVQRFGWPEINQHALQVEIRRDFYMNEETREKNEKFKKMQSDCSAVTDVVAKYVKSKFGAG